MKSKPPFSYIVLGVSGVGKSTIGQMLADHLSLPFYDADDFHPTANVQKMTQGIPLDDTDRWPWLEKLHQLLLEETARRGMVLACSALKESYRQVLQNQLDHQVRFIFLQAPYEFLLQRMRQREGHFMPVSLLLSQFQTLEIPQEAIVVDARKSVEGILEEIELALGKG